MNTDKIYAEFLAAEYAPKRKRKVIALRKLDRYAKRPAVRCAYAIGILATVLYGWGIYLIAAEQYIGLLVLVVGVVGMAVNCPLYNRLLEWAKQRYAFDIVELAKDICGYEPY